MTLNYVSLTLDLLDGQGNCVNGGTATFTPSAQLTDAGIEITAQAPIVAAFKSTASPVIKLLATDNGALLPNGWQWAVTFTGVPGSPAGFSFLLPFSSGSAQSMSSLAPVAPVTLRPSLITVSPAAPGNPQTGDIWIQES